MGIFVVVGEMFCLGMVSTNLCIYALVCGGDMKFKLPKARNGNVFFLRVNVTTGYTLVKTRHSRVPTYLQRETDTVDWSTPTFTLPWPKNGGVYPATSTFLQNCTPIFRNVP